MTILNSCIHPDVDVVVINIKSKMKTESNIYTHGGKKHHDALSEVTR